MGSASLTNSLATFVSQVTPTTNYNNSYGIYLRTGGAGDAFGYLYFPRAFPLQATIISASITIYNTTAMASATHTLTLQRLNQSFSASKVTYNTRPTSLITGTKTKTFTTTTVAASTAWTFDVTDWMQTIANGGVNYGMRVITNEAILYAWYSDIHPSAQFRPRLDVVWSDAPNTPSGLSPSGGRAVGLAKPILRAVYLDVSGATSLAAIQVQLNATDVWTAPSFDSGTVLTSTPELDLSLTAYAGLADGSTTFWRVRLQDAAGIWSPWSASTSFKRDDKGTLSVTNPPSGTPKVEDTTPPVIWSFTGETQAAYQIQITHLVNGAIVTDWDSGKITSTATTVTVPSGKIVSPTVTYNVTVRIWDNKQREATPGSPTYQELSRDFTFIPGATIGTTNLVLTAGDPRPKVTLTWQRTSSPDAFNVLRNGKVIQGGLLPGDVFVSGTTYTWVDNSPSPGRALTYEVQGVVGGVASLTNATAVVTVRSSGTWLREPVTGLELHIAGNEDKDSTLGKNSAALTSIAPNANAVLINQSLGGLQTPIEGQLISIYGLTAQQWRDQYIQMRALRVKEFWLTEGDYTRRVVCDFETYGRRGVPENVFKVGFMTYQQDSLSTILLGS